jgi:hypothetical protein
VKVLQVSFHRARQTERSVSESRFDLTGKARRATHVGVRATTLTANDVGFAELGEHDLRRDRTSWRSWNHSEKMERKRNVKSTV